MAKLLLFQHQHRALRAQLDQLHAEAETTRAKASSARLRLLRLSEAAEKPKRQAAINVHTGKGNDAKELLFQKKKVMQAMEKSKNRIELLDELSAKLNGALHICSKRKTNVADVIRLVDILKQPHKIKKG